MKKLFLIFTVMSFILTTENLTAKEKIKPEEIKKIKKMAVLPFCPTKKKAKSKKYEQLGDATALIISYQYRKYFKVNNNRIKVLSYKRTKKILERNGKEWRCYKKDEIPEIAKLLKVDAILYGTLLKATKKNESGVFDYIRDTGDAAMAETIRVKIKFKIRDKNGKLIASKITESHYKGSIISNKIDQALYAEIFKSIKIKDKYKIYFTEIFGAGTKFYNWLWDEGLDD